MCVKTTDIIPIQTDDSWVGHEHVVQKLEPSHAEPSGEHTSNWIDGVNEMTIQLLENYFLTHIVKIELEVFSTRMKYWIRSQES